MPRELHAKSPKGRDLAKPLSRTPADLERVRRVATAAELLEITLTDIAANRAERAPARELIPALDVSVRTRHDISGDHLHAWVIFSLSSEPAVFEVRATFRLVYRLPQKMAAADLKAFTGVNAVFNAWPFWRELVHNSAARMNLPPPTVPLLKI